MRGVRWAGAIALAACARAPSHDPKPQAVREVPDSATAPVDAAAAAQQVFDAGADLVDLDVPHFKPAVVSVPNGTTDARPVVVAVHGVGDRPDWQCQEWRRLVGGRAWVLCPRGVVSTQWSTRGDTRWTWNGATFMKREIDAALEALAARFGPEHVDEEKMVYAGFSYGAANGIAVVAQDAARFPYVVLTEGGGDRWTEALARAFVAGGGARVLFVCGQKYCVTTSAPSEAILRRAKAGCEKLVFSPEGHAYGGGVAQKIRDEWTWVTDGDVRFALPL
jgi:predicted esterase